MKAARIHRFGPPEVIEIDEVAIPAPNAGEVVVRTAAVGVGPWDALIREHKSAVSVPLPITLGTDLAGIVESVGSGVTQFRPGDAVYGATNRQFIGAYAEYSVVSAAMIAPKPKSLNWMEAGSVPVVAVTAWQMLFDYAQCRPGESVLVHGAAGNVGAYAVQLAKHAGLSVYATARKQDLDYVRALGADVAIDYMNSPFEKEVPKVEAVLDTVGGETQRRSFDVLKPGGILVSAVSPLSGSAPQPPDHRFAFFLVDVTTERLQELTSLFDAGQLKPNVGSVLPFDQVRTAHRMLAGAPHARGKIVLAMSGLDPSSGATP